MALTADSGVASGLEAIRIRARADWRLARISRVQYRLDDSESHARAAVAACQKVLQMNARLVLGGVLRRQGKWDQSLQVYRGVLADSKRRAAEDPGSAQRQRELARNHGLLADMLSAAPGRSVEVRENVRSSIAISEKLAASDPQDKGAQSELAQALSLGAEALLQPEDQLEVERYLRRALPVFQSLLRREPDSGTYLLYTGLTEAELGDCLGHRNLNRESLQRIRNGLLLVAKLVARDPSDMTNRIELLKLKRVLARNLARAGEAQEALLLSTDVLAKAREVSGAQGSQTEIPMRELPRAYALLGMVHGQSGHRDESQRWYRMAVSEWDSLRDKGYSLRDAERDILEAKSGVLKR